MATPNYGYEKRQKELAKKRKKEEKLKEKSERKARGPDADYPAQTPQDDDRPDAPDSGADSAASGD